MAEKPIRKVITLTKAKPQDLIILYDFFKIDEHNIYEDNHLNGRVLSKAEERCYLPARRRMKQLIEPADRKFKFAFSGVIPEQAHYHRPVALEKNVDRRRVRRSSFLSRNSVSAK